MSPVGGAFVHCVLHFRLGFLGFRVYYLRFRNLDPKPLNTTPKAQLLKPTFLNPKPLILLLNALGGSG